MKKSQNSPTAQPTTPIKCMQTQKAKLIDLLEVQTMKKIQRLLLTTLLTFCFVTTFSQTADSLSVFPNPFSVSTTVHFDIAQTDTITLRVFNTVGQTVMTFFNSTILPNGSYNINWLGDSIADGIYFVRLEIGSTKTITKKAIKNSTTSIKTDKKTEEIFKIFPNPTNDLITIPFDGSKTIILTDLNGKILKSFTTEQKVISLSDIAGGQYFLTILNNRNEKLTTQIVMKQQ